MNDFFTPRNLMPKEEKKPLPRPISKQKRLRQRKARMQIFSLARLIKKKTAMPSWRTIWNDKKRYMKLCEAKWTWCKQEKVANAAYAMIKHMAQAGSNRWVDLKQSYREYKRQYNKNPNVMSFRTYRSLAIDMHLKRIFLMNSKKTQFIANNNNFNENASKLLAYESIKKMCNPITVKGMYGLHKRFENQLYFTDRKNNVNLHLHILKDGMTRLEKVTRFNNYITVTKMDSKDTTSFVKFHSKRLKEKRVSTLLLNFDVHEHAMVVQLALKGRKGIEFQFWDPNNESFDHYFRKYSRAQQAIIRLFNKIAHKINRNKAYFFKSISLPEELDKINSSAVFRPHYKCFKGVVSDWGGLCFLFSRYIVFRCNSQNVSLENMSRRLGATTPSSRVKGIFNEIMVFTGAVMEVAWARNKAYAEDVRPVTPSPPKISPRRPSPPERKDSNITRRRKRTSPRNDSNVTRRRRRTDPLTSKYGFRIKK